MLSRNKISGILFFILLITALHTAAQVWPRENAKLNYRIVGFTFPAFDKKGYILEIAADTYDGVDSFEKHIIIKKSLKGNRMIAEIPFWANNYTWRIVGKSGINTQNTLRHFSTGKIPNTDTSFLRLRVVKKAEKHKNAFIFLDANRVLYDMKGNPVWYLPTVEGLDEKGQIQKLTDLHTTSQNTITFLSAAGDAYETDYNGKVLWQKKGDPKTEHGYFHHAFSRLANGHYMIMGTEKVPWVLNKDSSISIFNEDTKVIADPTDHIDFGDLIEYDEKGKEVWQWKSSVYYKEFIHTYKDISTLPYSDVHANAFFFDEKNRRIYVSFKNTSQLLKLTYPGGSVESVYGKPAMNDNGPAPLFCMQHAITHSPEGYLYLFNNNECSNSQHPQVVKLEESSKNDLKLIWAYEYPPDSMYNKIHRQLKTKKTTNGGNVVELTDHSMFVSFCKPYANIFIVSKEKKLLWNAVSEKWSKDLRQWLFEYQYRANIIKDRSELGKLIWKAEIPVN